MDKRRGGCAPNIAYTLALLGERPYLMATAGQDFKDYGDWLQAAGVDTSLVRQVPDKFTASFFCSTDTENNQIASFYIGAMANASELSFRTVDDPGLVIISPNDPGAMVQYAEECRTLGIPFIFDPGQQCARMSGDELRDGITGARARHLQRLRVRADSPEDGHGRGRRARRRRGRSSITRGEDGCSLYERAAGSEQPACEPVRA